MSKGDFGYGATAREYRDSPTSSRRSPGGFGSGYQRLGGSNFSELVDQIGTNIFTINNQTTSLERSLKQIGSKSDSVQLREKIHSVEQNTNKVINDTTQLLRDLSNVCSRNRNQQEKLQHRRLTNEFKDTVQRYYDLQKQLASRVKSTAPLSSMQKSKEPPTASLIEWGETVEDEEAQQEEERRRQQTQQQQVLVDEDLDMLQEREDQIKQLEGDILDINDIFRELGTLVHEQGEVIDTIEGNVESAYDHVEAGREELLKASNYQRKARKKMCILILILLIVAGIVALIIYLSVKK